MKMDKKIVVSLVIAVIFSSCFVGKKYSRPNNIVDNKLFRTETEQLDTSNMAMLQWKNLFTDTVLQNHIQHALDSNFNIRVAIQNIKSAEAYLKQIYNSVLPSIAIQPSIQFQTLSLNTPQGSGNSGNRISGFTYGLAGTLSWEADIWGKINSQKKAALANYLNTQAVQQAVQSQLIALVSESYFQLLALDMQKNILIETIQTRQENLATNKALKQAGTVTEVAVKQSEAQLLNVQAQLVTIENNIRALENTFSILLAQNPQKIARTKLTDQVINTPLTIGVPYQILSNRPDVLAAEFSLMNAFELTNVSKSLFYPSLNFTASTGLQSVDVDKLFNVNSLFASVIGSLTQPLFSQRKIRSQYEMSLAQQQIAYLNYRKTILTAGKEVSDALYNYETQNKLYSLKQSEYLALDTATQYSQDLLKYGMANYLDVLTAQQNALNAKIGFVNAAYGKLEAIIELYRALGGGK